MARHLWARRPCTLRAPASGVRRVGAQRREAATVVDYGQPEEIRQWPWRVLVVAGGCPPRR